MLEQYPDRQSPERASDVLFAATIAEALRRFDSFDVGHLLNVLSAENEPLPDCSSVATPPTTCVIGSVPTSGEPAGPAVGRSLESRIAAAGSLLDALHEWGTRGVLDPMDVAALKLRVAQSVIDSVRDDDAHD